MMKYTIDTATGLVVSVSEEVNVVNNNEEEFNMRELRIRVAMELRVERELSKGNLEGAKRGLIDLYDLDREVYAEGYINERTLELYEEVLALEERVRVYELYTDSDVEESIESVLV